jgi:hypothetical protein
MPSIPTDKEWAPYRERLGLNAEAHPTISPTMPMASRFRKERKFIIYKFDRIYYLQQLPAFRH